MTFCSTACMRQLLDVLQTAFPLRFPFLVFSSLISSFCALFRSAATVCILFDVYGLFLLTYWCWPYKTAKVHAAMAVMGLYTISHGFPQALAVAHCTINNSSYCTQIMISLMTNIKSAQSWQIAVVCQDWKHPLHLRTDRMGNKAQIILSSSSFFVFCFKKKHHKGWKNT